MSRNRYGRLGNNAFANGNGNGNGNANGYGSTANDSEEYDPYGTTYGDRYGTPPIPTLPSPAVRGGVSRQGLATESSAEKQIGVVLEHIKTAWPTMYEKDCVPVQVALQLLDTSSVGKAHEYRQFEKTHQYLQDSLKAIVHEHHQGFNSSIGTFHKIQASIQASQKRVRTLKELIGQSKISLGTTDPELRKLASQSQNYDDLIHTLAEIEDLRLIPDQLEARISEKRFLTAVEILQNALRRIRVPALDKVGALSDLRSYLTNQETALTDILVEELHDHLYLKSPYCQERWQIFAKGPGGIAKEKLDKANNLRPFYEVLESLASAKESRQAMIEDPTRNPEADTFYYIELLVESLNKLGRLESAVNSIKHRLPVELFGIVTETNSEVDQKHPSSLRGGFSGSHGNQAFGKENGIRADVIHDLLWTLYAKFEAIAEGHRVFHDVVTAIVEREGVRHSNMLLGSFRELWNLYQNEIRSLLHNYVTTDADVYQYNSSPKTGAASVSSRDHLFKFADADSKSVQMTTEYQELEGIIRAAVPGLMSNSRKPGIDGKKQLGHKGDHMSRRITNTAAFDSRAMGVGMHKSLVEPSVFNMSLLLPPTLGFLQRLKVIVPPHSDLVTSTLTTFLDNFLVNVFLPQLDETLGKLSDSVFEESDSFQQDPHWTKISRRPVFKGTAAFFALITAFCKMLATIPHDQALTQLIITQMMRYYHRCYEWFRSLASHVRDSDEPKLKLSAMLATEPGDINDTMQKLWTSESVDHNLLEKETGLLILQTNETPLHMDDVIMDRETISSLCVLYTSMKWLAIKVEQLRLITRNDEDSSHTTMQRSQDRRWTLLNDPSKSSDEQISVYLPMTQETVVQFDGIVSSYQNFAGTVLLTLHMEVRCQIINALTTALSPKTAPYLLEQVVNDPDPRILSLNADLISYDETIVRFLRDKEISFIRTGLGLLINSFLVTNAGMVKAINAHGCGRMQLNILVLQQNLKNIEADVGLDRAAKFFDLFTEGPDAVVKQAKELKENCEGKEVFTYDELKTVVELCYSEQLASPERGITTSATRSMADHMLQLEEASWTS